MTPQEILKRSQASRFVIQDFRPFAHSLEWELGQFYLHKRGSKAFTNDTHPIPFAASNDGLLSENAASILFENLAEADNVGGLDDRIFVLEVGIGAGMFARFFLDAFKRLCAARHKNYYERLSYVAADSSEQILIDARDNCLFSDHEGHYVLQRFDVLATDSVSRKPTLGIPQQSFFRAIFLNYLLDCLPAAHLLIAPDGVRELFVRTCLARHIDMKRQLGPDLAQIARKASSVNANERRELADLYEMFHAEYDYLPAAVNDLPYAQFAVDFARTKAFSKRILLNYGAIQCLEGLLDLVQNSGFILINDYEYKPQTGLAEFQHQVFSNAAFVGVNFSLIRAFFDSTGYSWVQPTNGYDHIRSSLLGKDLGTVTARTFLEQYDKTTYDWIHEPWQAASQEVQAGRVEAAMTHYHEAQRRQPSNWVLINEVASYLTTAFGDPAAGIDMATAAIRLNPNSSELWNTLGVAYHKAKRFVEAEQTYRKALEVNPDDASAWLNLSRVLRRLRRFRESLIAVANGMYLDHRNTLQCRLKAVQTKVLRSLAKKRLHEARMRPDRVSSRIADSS